MNEDSGLAALHAMETVISRVLQVGVLLSMGLIVVGGALWASRPPALGTAYPTTLHALAAGVAAGQPLAVIQLGLVVLLVTPVIRVAASALVFVRDRDTTFTAITLTVLALLLFGLLHGGGE